MREQSQRIPVYRSRPPSPFSGQSSERITSPGARTARARPRCTTPSSPGTRVSESARNHVRLVTDRVLDTGDCTNPTAVENNRSTRSVTVTLLTTTMTSGRSVSNRRNVIVPPGQTRRVGCSTTGGLRYSAVLETHWFRIADAVFADRAASRR